MLDRAVSENVHVPFIWRAEFVATLLTLSRNRRLRLKRVPSIRHEIDQLDLVHDDVPSSARSLIELARRHALSAYDATYLELALRLKLPLAARDAPLPNAADRASILLA